MKIIFMIRDWNQKGKCDHFQELYRDEYWKQIGDFEKYCDEYDFTFSKRKLLFLGIYEDWQYDRHEYCPDPTSRLEKKLNWNELFS